MASIHGDPDDAISFRGVWSIGDRELNAICGVAYKRLRKEDALDDLHCQVARSAQALVEFATSANSPDAARNARNPLSRIARLSCLSRFWTDFSVLTTSVGAPMYLDGHAAFPSYAG